VATDCMNTGFCSALPAHPIHSHGAPKPSPRRWWRLRATTMPCSAASSHCPRPSSAAPSTANSAAPACGAWPCRRRGSPRACFSTPPKACSFSRPCPVDPFLLPFLLGASAAAIALTTLVFPFVSEGYAFPWASFAAPLLAKGLVAPNLLHFVSHAAAVTVPFAIVAGAIVLAVEPRRSPYALTGIAVWALAGFLCVATWFPRGDGSRWYVENVYFERLDVLHRANPQLDPRFLRQMQVDRLLPPSSWSF